MKKEILRMSNICLSEGGIEIVRDGALYLCESEIVGLVGRNHAGKSSLLGAATGEFPCQSGEIWVEEHPKKIESIQQARKEGIFLIKDESSLIKEFTIKDTMKLNFAFAGKRERFSDYFKRCKEALDFLNVKDDYDTYIKNLNFHKRVLIEIAQALICNGKLLVLDNVMSMLSGTAREQMRQVFRMLQLRGISIILVENQADAIKEYLSRLYVMRKGKVVAMLQKEELEEELILSLIEGEPFEPKPGRLQKLETINTTVELLRFKDVYTDDQVISGLNFTLYENECLGIWNRNRHSGQGILDLLAGTTALASGEITVQGKQYDNQAVDYIKRYGVYIVAEEDQIFSNMPIGENIKMAALRRYAYGSIVPKEGELRYLVQDLCSDYFTDERYLLFSNQVIPDNILIRKKVSLCRAIAAGAKVIVYNNPSLKLDVREKEVFNQDILRTQKKRIGQVIIAAYLDDLYPVCNRIIQIEEGMIVGEI